MRFATPSDALYYWWNCLQDGGLPIHWRNREEEYLIVTERIQVSHRSYTPNNLLCAYYDIGKAIDRLSQGDRHLIKRKLLGYPVDDHRWSWVMRRLWQQIPQEYKYYGHRRTRRKTINAKRDSLLSEGTSRDSVQVVEGREAQGN